MSGDARKEMPKVSEMIDRLRRQFGLMPIDMQIRKGMRGEAVFYARENGKEVGAARPVNATEIYWDERGISHSRPKPVNEIHIEITLPGF